MNTLNKPNIKIYVFMKTAFENVGDALINKQMIELLAQNSSIEVDISRVPNDFLKSLSLDNIDGVKLRKSGLLMLLINMIRNRITGNRTIFMMMPGGNRGEKSIPKYLINRSYNQFLKFLKFLNIELFQIGVSFENLGPRYAKIIKERSKLLSKLLVRDHVSAEYLSKNMIQYDGILPDLAFNLPYDFKSLQTNIASNSRKSIAFSFRTGEDFLSKCDIIEIVSSVIETRPGLNFKFVSQVEEDAEFMLELSRLMQKNYGVKTSHENFTGILDHYISIYGDCQIIFSNRLHALLLGASAGAKPAAVLRPDHDMKIRGVLKAISLNERIFEAESDIKALMRVAEAPLTKQQVKFLETTQKDLRNGVRDLINS